MLDLQEKVINYQLSDVILREYDIRGIVDQNLSCEDAYYIGKSFASYVMKSTGIRTILVARDGRLSSPSLFKSLVTGILSAGGDVVDLGLGPTPMLYFAGYLIKASASIMITGSHNEACYNGFKMVVNSKPFFGPQIKKLGQMIEENDLLEGNGSMIPLNFDLKSSYLHELLDACLIEHELKIAWDPANGAAGEIIKRLCEKLPGKHFIINEEIDGNFPNHHPDPSIEKNLEQLKQLVLKHKCDFGVAFDGDADRLVVIDDKARMVSAEALISILAADILSRSPGATIIADVKASQTLFDDLKASGANPIMWKTGHSFVKAKMHETGALLAGEMSGHLFFADKYYGFDDGIYAAVRLIELMAKSDFPLSKLIDAMPKRFISSELRIECSEERKFDVIKEVKERLTEQNITFNDIDGVRVSNNSGWWLLRASNTQGALVARYEAYNIEDLQTMKHLLIEQLVKSSVDISFCNSQGM